MGGRASKTRPNAAAPLSCRGSFQTVIVLVDRKSECVDEMRSTIDGDHAIFSAGRNESHAAGGGGGDNSTLKVSKVQEILEGKIELKKHQQTLEHLPHAVANVAALELQLSSSEDSDDAGGRKKRKGAKKKTKKRRGSGERGTTSGSAAPSPVKVKLNDLKVPRKPIDQPQPMPDHFEQIKDAYALAEYTARDSTDATHSDLRPIALGKQQQRPVQQQLPPPPKPQETRGHSPFKSKQQPSPGSSPGKFFASAFENWRKPASAASTRSNHSQIMETRDPSRDSPPKSGNHAAESIKSATSSRDSSQQNVKRGTVNLGVECFELDGLESFASSAAMLNQAIELKSTDTRPPADTDTDTSERFRSERRNLRIDDTDESIMNDILAEVVT